MQYECDLYFRLDRVFFNLILGGLCYNYGK